MLLSFLAHSPFVLENGLIFVLQTLISKNITFKSLKLVNFIHKTTCKLQQKLKRISFLANPTIVWENGLSRLQLFGTGYNLFWTSRLYQQSREKVKISS